MYRNPIHYSLCLCALLTAGVSYAGSIEYTVSAGSAPNSERYTYYVSRISLMANQELDILFSPTLFSALANGDAGSGFDLELFQPNNPPGTVGHFSAFALVDHTPILSPMSLDVFYIGANRPTSLPFRINQFDTTGKFVATIDSGVVSATQAAPEPGSFVLVGVLFSGIGVWRAARRYREGAV